MRTPYPHHSKLKWQWPAPWVVVRDQAPLSNTAEDDVEELALDGAWESKLLHLLVACR